MAVKRQIVWGVASLATLYVGVASALGLGELKLDSALNQPLDATLFLQGGENLDPADIRVSLADPAAFRNAGLDRPHFLTELRFTPTMQNDQLVVKVQSPGPVREPYLNFLVELRRPNGRLLREYTLLLDPPMYQPPSSPLPRSVPAAAATPQHQRQGSQAEPRQAVPVPAAAPLPRLAPAADARQYRTAAGDSLWGIASRARPSESMSITDTMRAIRALNPDAFIDGDPSRLRVGQLLTLPTAEQLGAGTGSDGAAAPRSAEPGDDVANPLIPPRTPTSDSDSMASAGEGATASGRTAKGDGETDQAGTARLRIEEEGLARQANADAAELADRLRSLEARFNVMLDELDARDRQIASLQAELEILRQAQQAEGEGGDVSAAGPMLTEAESTEGPVSASGSENPEAGAIDAQVLPAVAESPDSLEQQQSSTETGQAEAEPSLLARWWPALLGLLVALVALLLFARRRAGNDDQVDAGERIMPAQPTRVAPQAAAPLAAALAQDAVAGRPASVRTAPKPVDPLDGVELYLTYGRFAEARGMLDKAIADQPNRLDLRYKQLRVLAELGEARAFAAQERQLLEKRGDAARIEQIKTRFPDLFKVTDTDLVEQIDHLEPILPDEPAPDTEELSGQSPEELTATQLNLNDFTLDPDWELIEGLTPTPPRKGSDEAGDKDVEEPFESSLHEFPEIEELHDGHDEHFPGIGKDSKSRLDDK